MAIYAKPAAANQAFFSFTLIANAQCALHTLAADIDETGKTAIFLDLACLHCQLGLVNAKPMQMRGRFVCILFVFGTFSVFARWILPFSGFPPTKVMTALKMIFGYSLESTWPIQLALCHSMHSSDFNV